MPNSNKILSRVSNLKTTRSVVNKKLLALHELVRNIINVERVCPLTLINDYSLGIVIMVGPSYH